MLGFLRFLRDLRERCPLFVSLEPLRAKIQQSSYVPQNPYA
eukprot:COSAG04_NODE_2960_length_3344_cov_1.189214_2_plen_41_part_00